jgi:hypothetical protein
MQVLPEGMAGLWAELSAVDAFRVWAHLGACAEERSRRLRSVGAAVPGIDALRADTLVGLILRATPTSETAQSAETAGPDLAPAGGLRGTGRAAARGAGRVGVLPRCRCGGRATAAVVVDLPTLLGLADNPGELAGYGPVPAPLARQLAADTDWVRWTVDPGTGRLVDVGARHYRPSNLLAAHITAAQRTCGFPGCSRPAAGCDLDHVVEFRRGGRTVRRNLGPLCRQHHNAKTHGGWTLHYDPHTGTRTWTSPLGKTYRNPPTHPSKPEISRRVEGARCRGRTGSRPR